MNYLTRTQFITNPVITEIINSFGDQTAIEATKQLIFSVEVEAHFFVASAMNDEPSDESETLQSIMCR